MTIKVLGPGCSSCKKLHKACIEAIKQSGKDIDLKYITDMSEIMDYGVMSMPVLMIDEKVITQGKELKVNEVLELINNPSVESKNYIPTGGCSCNCGCDE